MAEGHAGQPRCRLATAAAAAKKPNNKEPSCERSGLGGTWYSLYSLNKI